MTNDVCLGCGKPALHYYTSLRGSLCILCEQDYLTQLDENKDTKTLRLEEMAAALRQIINCCDDTPPSVFRPEIPAGIADTLRAGLWQRERGKIIRDIAVKALKEGG